MAAPAPRPARVVLVVGGTSGIGLATAQRLSARGDLVVVAARDAGRVARVAADLPGRAGGLVLDLLDPASLDAAIERCVRDHGRLDAVVTTAQVMAYGTLEQVPPDVFATVVDTAVMGTVHLARAALPALRRDGGGHLVVVGSLLGEIAVPSMSAYCTGKWGQLGLVRSLQIETRRERALHVSLVLPGAVDTPIYHQAATYAGSPGSAPPPVVGPDRVARAVERVLDKPRRIVHVGPGNLPTVTGFRLMPGVFDRLAGPLVARVALRGPRTHDSVGNVDGPRPEAEGLRGGWTPTGRLRRDGGRPRWRRRRETPRT